MLLNFAAAPVASPMSVLFEANVDIVFQQNVGVCLNNMSYVKAHVVMCNVIKFAMPFSF